MFRRISALLAAVFLIVSINACSTGSGTSLHKNSSDPTSNQGVLQQSPPTSSVSPTPDSQARTGGQPSETAKASQTAEPALTSTAASTPKVASSPANPSKPASPESDTSSRNAGSISDNLHFIVMADSRGSNNGINMQAVKSTLERIKQLSPQPEFAVVPGDLVDGAKGYSQVKSQLENFKKTVTEYYPADFFYPGIGNHEVTAGSDGEKAFAEVFPEIKAEFLEGYNNTVYFFDKMDTRFFMLNSNHPGESHIVSDKQLDWVKTNLRPVKTHDLFFVHEPPFPTGDHVGSSLDAKPLQRDKLWKVIDTSNAPMVFCGHEHFYTRRHIDSNFNTDLDGVKFMFDKLIYQVTVGSFGAPLYSGYKDKRGVDVPPVSQYHFSVVDISGDKISVKVYGLDGKIIDSFEQSSWTTAH